MNDSQILSIFPTPAAPGAPARRPLVYDACQVGVVLRAVLFVETVMAVGAMFSAGGPADWLLQTAVLSGAALPATLAWLVVSCGLKNVLARLPPAGQQSFGVLLGALA